MALAPAGVRPGREQPERRRGVDRRPRLRDRAGPGARRRHPAARAVTSSPGSSRPVARRDGSAGNRDRRATCSIQPGARARAAALAGATLGVEVSHASPLAHAFVRRARDAGACVVLGDGAEARRIQQRCGGLRRARSANRPDAPDRFGARLAQHVALAAAGAQLIVAFTGLDDAPVGSPICPVIAVAGESDLHRASATTSTSAPMAPSDALWATALAVLAGAQTAAEARGSRSSRSSGSRCACDRRPRRLPPQRRALGVPQPRARAPLHAAACGAAEQVARPELRLRLGEPRLDRGVGRTSTSSASSACSSASPPIRTSPPTVLIGLDDSGAELRPPRPSSASGSSSCRSRGAAAPPAPSGAVEALVGPPCSRRRRASRRNLLRSTRSRSRSSAGAPTRSPASPRTRLSASPRICSGWREGHRSSVRRPS